MVYRDLLLIRLRFGGKKGIRTPETLLRFTRFPGGPVQPLLHLSVGMAQKYAIFPDSANDGDFFCTAPPDTDSDRLERKVSPGMKGPVPSPIRASRDPTNG